MSWSENRGAGNLVVGGVDLFEEYGVAISDECELGTPEPKTYTVDVPGGDGCIDLTESLTGHAHYGMREAKLPLMARTATPGEWREVVSGLLALLHNRAHDFTMAMDPSHTWHGRFSVGAAKWSGGVGTVEVTASCDPWLLREHHSESFDAVGGTMRTLPCGVRPVHPIITCSSPTTVIFGEVNVTVPGDGSPYRLNDVLLEPGENEVWFNIYKWATATWADLAAASKTWDDMAGTAWAHVLVSDGDASGFTGDGTVTVEYDVEDL